MPIEINNTLRGTSIIRVEGIGTNYINITDLRANTTTETVNAFDIKRLYWSTNGNISITRNNVPMLALHNAGEMRLDEYGHSIANNSTSNLAITITTGGSLVMEITKDTSYNVALTGF